MTTRLGGRWLAPGLVILTGLIVARCSSPEKTAMKRSAELVAALKQQSIPGLPETLTTKQAMEIERGRSGPGAWFVETGCFACHDVSVYGVKSYTPMGPDLSLAVQDVQSRFGRTIDDFWHTPNGTMTIVRMQMIKLSPDQEGLALQKLKEAFAEYQRQQAAKTNEKR